MREVIRYSGTNLFSSVAGQIRIEEGRGRMVIYDPSTQKERQVHDIEGSHYNDNQGREMTRVNTLGLTTIEAATGRSRNRVGVTSSDGRTGIWTSEPGQDLKDLLGE